MKESTIKRLLLVRDAIEEAKTLVRNDGSDYECMKAIWLGDLSIDLMLSTIASELSLSLPNKKRIDFEDLDKAVFSSSEPSLTALAAHRNFLSALHNQRNLVQHHGQAPSLPTARNNVYKTENFLSDAFKSVFQLDLSSLSLTEFITFENAKNCLGQAEQVLQKEEYTEAVHLISEAFGRGRREFFNKLRNSSDWYKYSHLRSWSDNLREQSQMDNNQEIIALANVIEVTRFGIDFNSSITYIETAPGGYIPLGSDEWVRESQHLSYDKETAEFLLHFVVNSLYKMQSSLSKITTIRKGISYKKI